MKCWDVQMCYHLHWLKHSNHQKKFKATKGKNNINHPDANHMHLQPQFISSAQQKGKKYISRADFSWWITETRTKLGGSVNMAGFILVSSFKSRLKRDKACTGITHKGAEYGFRYCRPHNQLQGKWGSRDKLPLNTKVVRQEKYLKEPMQGRSNEIKNIINNNKVWLHCFVEAFLIKRPFPLKI